MVKTLVDDVVERVIGYRQMIARGPMRVANDTPPLGSPVAAAQHTSNEPTPLRPREAR